MKDLIEQITDFEKEYKYEEEVVFSKFLKRHGEDYTREEFLKFLKKRYEVINKFNDPDSFG